MPDDSTRLHFVNADFQQAFRDYFYLVDRHFPEKGLLKLVGDRYRLTGDQRTVLYRGIASNRRSKVRKRLLTENISGSRIIIDGYNVLFTLINYRFGKITFISTDHIVRDAGSLHGKLKDYSSITSCITMLIDQLSEMDPARVDIYLDSPISHSEKHAFLIRQILEEKGINGDCSVIQSADWALRNATDDILAISDTGIIEKALLPLIDMPRIILVKAYNARFLDLMDLLTSEQTENTVDES